VVHIALFSSDIRTLNQGRQHQLDLDLLSDPHQRTTLLLVNALHDMKHEPQCRDAAVEQATC
jgi:hypothetical protein